MNYLFHTFGYTSPLFKRSQFTDNLLDFAKVLNKDINIDFIHNIDKYNIDDANSIFIYPNKNFITINEEQGDYLEHIFSELEIIKAKKYLILDGLFYESIYKINKYIDSSLPEEWRIITNMDSLETKNVNRKIHYGFFILQKWFNATDQFSFIKKENIKNICLLNDYNNTKLINDSFIKNNVLPLLINDTSIHFISNTLFTVMNKHSITFDFLNNDKNLIDLLNEYNFDTIFYPVSSSFLHDRDGEILSRVYRKKLKTNYKLQDVNYSWWNTCLEDLIKEIKEDN